MSQYDAVINVQTGAHYDVIPVVQLSEEEFMKRYSKNVPRGKKTQPYVDDIAIMLFENPTLLNTIQHYREHYQTYAPVFVEGNVLHPMEFTLAKLFNMFLEKNRRPEDEKLPDWHSSLLLALYKLEGKFYTSAGQN